MTPTPFASAQNWLVFVIVVLIWSTTPLAIVFSSDGIDPFLNLATRLSIAAFFLLAWYAYHRRALPFSRQAIPTHISAGAIGIGLSMSCVYYAAQTLPSSWIALIFGLTPVFVALLEGLFFRSLSLTIWHWLGILLASIGLWLIFYDPDHPLQSDALPALMIMLLGVFFHALSASLVKRIKHKLSPLDTVTGGLIVAVPIILLFWLLNGTALPQNISQQVTFSILYLAIIGSLAGFLLYYQVLAVFSATLSSFITIIAPSMALLWASLLNNEPITFFLMLGALLILLGLTVFMIKPADKVRYR